MIDDFHENLAGLVSALDPTTTYGAEDTEKLVSELYRELCADGSGVLSFSDILAKRLSIRFQWSEEQRARLSSSLHAELARPATDSDHATYVDHNFQLLHRLMIEWHLRRQAEEIARLAAEIERLKNPPPHQTSRALWRPSQP